MKADAVCLISIIVLADYENSFENDYEIEPDRPIVDIIEIVLDPLLQFFRRVGFAPPTVNLRPSGNAGFDPVPSCITTHNLFEWETIGPQLYGMWSWPDNRHIAR